MDLYFLRDRKLINALLTALMEMYEPEVCNCWQERWGRKGQPANKRIIQNMILMWPKIALLFLSYYISCSWQMKIQLWSWLLKNSFCMKSDLSSLNVLASLGPYANFSHVERKKVAYPATLAKVFRKLKQRLSLEFVWKLMELHWDLFSNN